MSKLLYAATQSETTHRGNHVVVLRSPIAYSSSTGLGSPSITWGNGEIPNSARRTRCRKQDFLDDLYGYVAGKPF